jgi:cobalt/nickel transport system permease protein
MLYLLRTGGHRQTGAWQIVVAGAAVALLVAFCLSPLASAAPDGLERVAEELGPVATATTPALVPLPDYQVTALGGLWIATSLAGVIGAAVVFALAWGLSRGMRTLHAVSHYGEGSGREST